MPIYYTETDIASILDDTDLQGNVAKQPSYSLWSKQNGSGVWEAYTTQPSGTVVEKNFLALFPSSPGELQVVQPCNGEGNVMYYAGTSNPVNLYKNSTTVGKWKCGLPV